MKKIFSVALLIFLGTNAMQAQQKSYPLTFDSKKYQTKTLTFEGKSFEVRAYENIVYVSHPVDTTYQKINIYIPEAYFQGKSINGYTAKTAPIFYPNKVGGYMPAKPGKTEPDKMGMMPPLNGEVPSNPAAKPDANQQTSQAPQVSTVVAALANGYVVASAGARGRTTKDAKGNYTGKAPAAIVDLKAAVRYLKFNDAKMPGDADKIIPNGTSAGGAMSTLLGGTGNHPDYEPYLKELGAAEGTDNIFAVSAYCPITNLDHADMAYEWQLNGVNDYKKIDASMLDYHVERKEITGKLSEEEIEVSKQLKALFPAYVNSLDLKDDNGNPLTLEENGEGPFKEWVKSFVITSAQIALDNDTDLAGRDWLSIKDGKVTDLDFDAYVHYMQRQKTPPAFDGLDLSTGENQEFGTETIDKQHFTDFAMEHSTVDGATRADETVVKMMNAMYYIDDEKTTVAKHWRIRHGTYDKDGGLAVPVILGTHLKNKGYDVDLALPWDRPHSGDYDLDELFNWIDNVCK